MNSNNSISSIQNEGYFGTLLLYFFIASLFFLLGKNYDRVRAAVRDRAA